jgi:hypothetical protein
MDDIYKGAKKVHVWLGEEKDGDRMREMMMALLEEIARFDPDRSNLLPL